MSTDHEANLKWLDDLRLELERFGEISWNGFEWSRLHEIAAAYRSLVSQYEAEFIRRNAVPIDDNFVDAVEGRVGMGHGAWDMEDPREIFAAAIAEFKDRAHTKLTPPVWAKTKEM